MTMADGYWNRNAGIRGGTFYLLQPSSSLPSGQSTMPSHFAFCFLKQISLPHLKVLSVHGMPKNKQKKKWFFLGRNRSEWMTLNAAKNGLVMGLLFAALGHTDRETQSTEPFLRWEP
jgi:hypothetical protein